jgi:hypothetical protein
MLKLKNYLISALIAFSIFYQSSVLAVTYGSDTAVSIESPLNVPPSTDNVIKTFACLKYGLGFQDSATTCSFQSVFPVSGPVFLRGGKLYLQSDLTLSNTATFADLGTIMGQDHMVTLCENATNFASETNPSGAFVLNLIARDTLAVPSRTFDWSYDGKYVIVGTTGLSFQDIYIYEFTGTSLILRANFDAPPLSINSVRWHPNSYYFAIGGSTLSNMVRSYQFTPPSTVTTGGSISFSAPYSIAFNKKGTHLAVGGTASTINVYSYTLNGSGGALSLVSTSTNSLGGDVSYDSIVWAPAGNKEDLIVGTNNSGTTGNLHLYNFTGSALNHLKAYAQGKAVNTVDWCATSTYMAAGFQDGTIRTYQHTAATNNITLKQSYTSTGVVNSVNWKYNASELASARASAAANEFQIYSFNTSTYALSSKYNIALTTDAYCVRYLQLGSDSYIGRTDNSTKYFSVYKENYSPFVFQDVKLYLNNNLILEEPLTLAGTCVINGRGNKITVTNNGSIHVPENSSLEIALTDLEFKKSQSFSMQGNTSEVSFRNTSIALSNDVLFGDGKFDVYDDLTITGPHTFQYLSDNQSTIHAHSQFTIQNGAELKLGKVSGNDPDPIAFENNSAILNLNNATLHTTNSGLKITHGTVNIYGNSNFQIDWTQSDTLDTKVTATNQGLVFGDGSSPGTDPWLILNGNGSTLEVNGGGLVFDPAITYSMLQFYGEAQLALNGTSTFFVKRPLMWVSGWCDTATTAKLLVDPTACLSLNRTRVSYDICECDFILTGSLLSQTTLTLDKDDYLILKKGALYNIVNVARDGNRLSGYGVFQGQLNFTDANSKLTWNDDSQIYSDINLNGGTMTFKSDGRFAANKTLVGSGIVEFLGSGLHFGPSENSMTSSIYWKGTPSGKIYLGNQTSFSGTWTFDGDITLNGNGNILDLSNHGALTIKPNSTLTFENIGIKGLGQGFGQIYFMDDTATLRLSNAYLELDNNFATTTGGVYVNGPATIGLKDYDWTLDQNASMTIDGVTLWKDPLDKINYGNIKFGTGSIEKYLSLVSSGTIKTMANLDSVSTDTANLNALVINNSNAINYQSEHFISVNDGTLTVLGAVNGITNVAGCSMISGPINLAGGTLTLSSDMALSNETTIVSSGNFDLQGSSMIFGGDLAIPSGVSIKVTSDGVLDGQGNNFAIAGQLIVDSSVSVTLRNMNFVGHSTEPIQMRSATSELVLQDAYFTCDRDFSFTQGKLFIQDDVFYTGTNKFSYASTATAYIGQHSTLCFDKNTTFSYSPRATGRHALSERNLIKMADKTSEIIFDECTLQLPDSGWQLTNGTIYFNNHVDVYGEPYAEQSFEFGNGVSANDPDVLMLSGANLGNHGYIYTNFGS